MAVDARLGAVKWLRIAAGVVVPLPWLLWAIEWDAINRSYFRETYDTSQFWLINGTIIAVFAAVGFGIAGFARQSLKIGLALALAGLVLVTASAVWLFR